MTQEELQEEIDKRLPDELQLGRDEIEKGLVQLFKQYVAEVIGEDEKARGPYLPFSGNEAIAVINHTKAEQRKRAGL